MIHFKKFIFVFILTIIVFTTTIISAESETNIEEINYYEYTDDEYFYFDGIKYEFEKYIDSIIGVNNPQPEQSLYVCNTSFYMNDIGKIVM